MNYLSPVQIINDYINNKPVEDYPTDYWRASSAGYCMRRMYYQRKGVEQPNPINNRVKRVFAVGDVFHEWVQDIMQEFYGDELTHAEADVDIPSLNVKGHNDNILKLNDTWTLIDYKSQHSGAFWHAKNEGGMMKPHQRLQMGTYLYGLQKDFPGINGLFVFISKDDLVMEQVPLYWSEQLKEDVESYWMMLNDYWNEQEVPPCTCGWEKAYCPYQTSAKSEPTGELSANGKKKYKKVYTCCESLITQEVLV